jgi:NAD(P)H-dependent flavin oxidoreductase YrpB (nitropropane dioxygenase family)
LPYPLQLSAVSDVLRTASQGQDTRYMPMWAGQSVGNIHDLPGAAEIVARLVRESRDVLDRMREL